MKDNRVTNILLILLLFFNIAFIGTWWYNHMKEHRKPPFEQHDHFDEHDSKGTMFMLKQLGFDSVQKSSLEILHKEHSTRSEALQAAILRNQKGLMKALMATPADSVHANICADSIGVMKTLANKELFRYFRGIKELCTPEQKTKFSGLIEKMSEEFPHRRDIHHPDDGPKRDSN